MDNFLTSHLLGAFSALGVAGLGTFIAARYHIAKPHETLVKTGLGIRELHVAKHTIQWPLQEVHRVDLRPSNFTFRLHNMSKEKVEFSLPMSFTIGPIDPLQNPAGFQCYARKMLGMDEETINKTILGVVEGETRGLSSVLSIEEMFNAKDRFKQEVVAKIQEHLEQLGLVPLNANVKDMSDYDDKNKYFEFVKRQAIETANYQAQVSVSEARKNGEIGVKERERDTTMALATLTMETRLVQNERTQKVVWSDSELDQQKSEAKKAADMKRIETVMQTMQFEQDMKKEVEKKRQEQEMARLRATELTQTHLEAEQKTRQAEANAQVIRTMAEAEAMAVKVKADAELEQEKKRAEGIQVVLEAQAQGLERLTSKQDPEFVKYYLGLKDRLYQELAHTQAVAFKEMKPQFNIWTTGPQADQTSPSDVITRTLQNMAPLFSGLNQSGVKIPFITGSTVTTPSSSPVPSSINFTPSPTHTIPYPKPVVGDVALMV